MGRIPLPRQQASLFAILAGDTKINVHPPALWVQPEFTPRGPTAQPGCGDVCFVWDGDVAGLRAARGAPVETGPAPREGGRGGGNTVLYSRDPDGNLLEFIVNRTRRDSLHGSSRTALEDGALYGQQPAVVGAHQGDPIGFAVGGEGERGRSIVSYTGLLSDGRMETL